MTRRLGTLLGVLVVLLVGASGAVGAQEDTPAVEVAVYADRVEPASVEIAPGQTVRWTAKDVGPFELRASDGSWSSGQLVAGMSYRRTFDTSGRHGYRDVMAGECTDQGCPGASGVVVVHSPAKTTTVVPEVPPEEPRRSAGATEPHPAPPSQAPAPSPPTSSPPAPAATEQRPVDRTPRRASALILGAGPSTAEATTQQPDVVPEPLVAPPRPTRVRFEPNWQPQAWMGPVELADDAARFDVTLGTVASAILALTLGSVWREHLRGRGWATAGR